MMLIMIERKYGGKVDEKSRLLYSNHSIHCNNSGIPEFTIWIAMKEI